MTMRALSLLVMILIVSTFKYSQEAVEAGGPPPPFHLRCEYLKDPMGVDVESPRLSWLLDHVGGRGQVQAAYQILVSERPEVENGEIWDSGRVDSDRNSNVPMTGAELKGGRTYYWKVKTWDGEDRESPFSATARFDMGLLDSGDWEGEWITGENQLRKEFSLEGDPVRARAYICGLGYSELHVNGNRVGDRVLDPGWTTYSVRLLYTTHDITHHLRRGKNAVGVVLGRGWYRSRALLLQIHIDLDTGESVSLVSDKTWTTAPGPLLEDSLYDGEVYDARLETPGWTKPGFDEKGWTEAESAIRPGGRLSAQMMPPIRVVDSLAPRSRSQPAPGIFVYDMGQNMSGWVRLRVSGPRGKRVRMRFAELIYPSGRINRENLRTARAEDVYILKGGGEDEEYEPRFTYHGFRYVEITGFPGVPALEDVEGRVVHTDVEQTGNFSCSTPLLNRLQNNILWGQKTNLHSIPTDCCQRDERMGWLGDAHVTAEEAMLNFDMAAFYTNFLRNIRDVQGDDGSITDTVPHIWGQRPADPAWGAAYPILCWSMYTHYGDTRILEEHYDGLKKYVRFLEGRADNGLATFSHYGDWVAIEKTPGGLVSGFFHYYSVKILADAARVLGRTEDAERYSRQAEGIKAAFNRAYFDPKTRSYAGNTQTANALPLFLDLAPEEARGGVMGHLRQDVLYGHDTHLTTGFIGARYIMDVLTRFGSLPLAYELATRTSYPSWGYMLENGATTLWEVWQNKTGPGMNSHNHPMFGSVGAWLYTSLAGIRQEEGSAGFDRIRFVPGMVRDLRFASAEILTVRGRVACEWKRSDNSLSVSVEVPVSCRGEILIPKFNLTDVRLEEGGAQIYSGGKFRTGVTGIRMIEETDEGIIVLVGSGRYEFVLKGE